MVVNRSSEQPKKKTPCQKTGRFERYAYFSRRRPPTPPCATRRNRGTELVLVSLRTENSLHPARGEGAPPRARTPIARSAAAHS